MPLVDRLVRGDPRCRIDQPSRTTLVLSVATEDGTTTFTLRQRVWGLRVRWTNESPRTGRREREWTFCKFTPQCRMTDRIHDDLLAEHQAMMRS